MLFSRHHMRNSLKILFPMLAALLPVAGCASHPRDFIPNGAGVNLAPTNPAHILVLNSVPRGMIIGTVLVDRSKAKNTQEIIEAAREKAASVGADFIVWEDSLGTLPVATPTPGEAPSQNNGELAHPIAGTDGPPPEEMSEKRPQARFTVGIFLPDRTPGAAQ
jgi:hypothetical protein